MSLAMYAAPFDNDENQINDDNISKKRVSNNKTQKRYPTLKDDTSQDRVSSDKVMSVLKTIHNLPEQNEMANFSPIAPPTSAGVESTRMRENVKNEGMNYNLNKSVSNSLSNNKFSSFVGSKNDAEENEDYYKRFIPNYEEMYKHSSVAQNDNPHNQDSTYIIAPPQTHSQQSKMNVQGGQDVLIEKLNYMIRLLEDNQDEKTNNITEEVILYSFLGIFIIFIVDSFTKVSKYTR